MFAYSPAAIGDVNRCEHPITTVSMYPRSLAREILIGEMINWFHKLFVERADIVSKHTRAGVRLID
jgi:hypothetical protein